ncbi:MAG TPA: hypothetical protein VNT22_11180, partial [Baekduia sp.]|nr:hypothetical protein [Baekduia sp.]
MRSPSAGFTSPTKLSDVPASDVYVASAGSGFFITWAASELAAPAEPAVFDLHVATRGNGNAIGGEIVVPGAR